MTEIPEGYHQMSKDQWHRKYVDTHAGLHAMSELAGKTGNLVKTHPEDKNITHNHPIKGKNLLENRAIKKRANNFRHFVLDTVSVRNEEILDKEAVPMKDLLNLAAKILPQQKEDLGEEKTATFADMVKTVTIEMRKYDTVDVEAEAANGFETVGGDSNEVQE